ncbi:hypothetical protein RvY_00532 [Ramazzottius varieornatus]|uniref:Glycosyltransferase 2-like domain-containing protein n=1 Tax=Ramazzottius varieornatus TaxID=947166 RepID=A0A1D1UN04_RAMVA|nr:hypothetical protein RvY_00532 [Ramazzottius varieornatus]
MERSPEDSSASPDPDHPSGRRQQKWYSVKEQDLQHDLSRYLAQYFPSNLIQLRRFQTNRGLIKARLDGATAAKAEVLVFLDSHCEVSVGWLEPLLERIKENRKVFACPVVDSMNEETLDYEPIVGFRATGLFSWSMYFTWGRRHEDDVPDEDDWKPYR